VSLNIQGSLTPFNNLFISDIGSRTTRRSGAQFKFWLKINSLWVFSRPRIPYWFKLLCLSLHPAMNISRSNPTLLFIAIYIKPSEVNHITRVKVSLSVCEYRFREPLFLLHKPQKGICLSSERAPHTHPELLCAGSSRIFIKKSTEMRIKLSHQASCEKWKFIFSSWRFFVPYINHH
jgi:hypothetical protein